MNRHGVLIVVIRRYLDNGAPARGLLETGRIRVGADPVSSIHAVDGLHVLLGKRKVEERDVFSNALRRDRLGDDDEAALHVPAQADLSASGETGCTLRPLAYRLAASHEPRLFALPPARAVGAGATRRSGSKD